MEPQIVHPVEPVSAPGPKPSLLLGGVVAVIVLGTLAGFLLSRSSSSVAGTGTNQEIVKSDTEAGSTDTKTFRDSAQGTLEVGGIKGEGTHKLVRDGGPSQTVYMVSSVVDLAEFVGKKVEVRGETLKATTAPWLMDVGYVKILE